MIGDRRPGTRVAGADGVAPAGTGSVPEAAAVPGTFALTRPRRTVSPEPAVADDRVGRARFG